MHIQNVQHLHITADDQGMGIQGGDGLEEDEEPEEREPHDD